MRFQSLLNVRFIILICLQPVQKVTATASPHELAPRKTSELAETITAVHYGVIVLFLSAAKNEVTVSSVEFLSDGFKKCVLRRESSSTNWHSVAGSLAGYLRDVLKRKTLTRNSVIPVELAYFE